MVLLGRAAVWARHTLKFGAPLQISTDLSFSSK